MEMEGVHLTFQIHDMGNEQSMNKFVFVIFGLKGWSTPLGLPQRDYPLHQFPR